MKGNVAKIRKGNNHLLDYVDTGQQHSLLIRPSLQLSCPTFLHKKVYNRIGACHVKWSTKGEKSANIFREREMTCSWVVVPATKLFYCHCKQGRRCSINRTCIHLFGSVHYSYPFSLCKNGALSSQLVLSVDVVNFLLLNIDLLHVCLHVTWISMVSERAKI